MQFSPDLESSLRAAIKALPDDCLQRLEEIILPAAEAANRDKLSTYRPYAKQMQFHAAGLTHRERLLMAANQVGKTWAAAYELAMHLTGRYPAWWRGKRFERPVRWIAGSETSALTKKGIQRVLLGDPEKPETWGTGTIPGDALVDTRAQRSIPDAVASIIVRHVNGDVSVCQLASYDQGRERWQADTVDGVWFDEEPPMDIYSEGLTRTNTTMGPVMMTFTPLMGETAVVKRYRRELSPDRIIVSMTLDDADHYTPEQRAKIEASYPEHEREARAKGIPVLGSGLIFPVARSVIECAPFVVPPHWPAIGGIDFGWEHPTAAVMLRHDPDADKLYVTHAYRQARALPVIHTAALKPWNGAEKKLPWAWPHDGYQHDKQTGVQTADDYRAKGLDMLPDKATFDDGSNGVEAGVQQMLERMQTGRFKVFSHLNEWFEEQSTYHRKDGVIVKEVDDLMAATRYAYMMRRFAIVIDRVPEDRYGRRDRYSKGGRAQGSPMVA